MSEKSTIEPITRAQRLAKIADAEEWDLVIIGGGITGAGIFKLASQIGLKALLVEQKDFAWGSSSRSSKMVHGGLRYIAEGQIKLTQESVQERQRLMRESQGLVQTQSFALSHYKNIFPRPWIFNFLLSIYDLFAGKKQHSYWSQKNYQFLAPGAKTKDATGGTQFVDAITDDARLVLRLIQESEQLGNLAINYLKVIQLNRENDRVVGVTAKAEEHESSIIIKAKHTINATGAWANQWSESAEQPATLRPLRGSHLIVASWRLPVASAISVPHPTDKRPVQIYPWQNVTVIGTTDVEHSESLNEEPRISLAEYDYLMDCVDYQFPSAKLKASDIISTFAGVRPVIASGGFVEPSKEKREHSIWKSEGLITIAGGKLTTFRVIAQEVIKLVTNGADNLDRASFEQSNLPSKVAVEHHICQQLHANFGSLVNQLLSESSSSELCPIGYSMSLWAELIWSLKYEQVIHLDDLLLRRTRIGNVLPDGALNEMKKIKQLTIQFLNWTEDKWLQELIRYQHLWQNSYSLPKDMKLFKEKR